MKGYGQFCPVAQAAEIVGERWTPLVLRELLSGSHRFNDLQRGVPLMSPSLLSQRLRKLEAAGIIWRGHDGAYHLTPAGEELRPVIETLGAWGQRWVRTKVEEEDVDVALLMWDIRRRVSLPEDLRADGRAVIQFRVPDAPTGKGRWWLILEDDQADLCLHDPGFEVDLWVTANRRELAKVWMGDVAVDRAVDDGRLDLHGSPMLARSFPRWFHLSVFAGVTRPH
ncbi:Transcriptional regulator, HxlR family [Caenispirillum salinarum AK4]|uniref:Transcriptional regulator, HxlR family n=1 Tax=Caenispirillum salinarum AK4 TaxID=1238182 RepID=K9H272_9PROT|nr:winged helix-turn-helix transcriptional regulator [Caenispirillum salinarum]EKV31632.1 Transcriptional regulator, HxlR family [Caenispirillum salinarum AK4]